MSKNELRSSGKHRRCALRMVRVNCNFSPFNTPTCNFLLANLHFLLYDCTGMTTEYALCKILSS